MIILACGDRNWKDYKKIRKAIREVQKKWVVSYLIEGGQQKSVVYGSMIIGADHLANKAAKELGIQTVKCEANWERHKKAAGPIRNQMQLNLALKLAAKDEHQAMATLDNILVLAFHSDLKNSKGTKDMVKRAKKAGVKVKVIK